MSFAPMARHIDVSTRVGHDERALWVAASAGDRDAFAYVTGRYRRELQVHCYRMLGSFEDAEDLVQETLLRAWRRRETYQGRSTLRAWLYGIATNACLDALDKRSRRLLPTELVPPADPLASLPPASEIPWLEPYPDSLLDEAVDDAAGPEELAFAQETIELAFLVAIQHLPPRQRAVLILRDLLGWSASETARVLAMTVVAANSALQRARETLAQRLPSDRVDWARQRIPDPGEQVLLRRYVEAWERSDVDGLVALLAEDARFAMPPMAAWYEGRDAIGTFLAGYPLSARFPRHIHVPTRANRQPAFGVFFEGERGSPPRPVGVEVLRIERGLIAEIDVFLQPELIEWFGITPPA
jgi:RNA polymerase sigma-70 factor (ECF subfamily)